MKKEALRELLPPALRHLPSALHRSTRPVQAQPPATGEALLREKAGSVKGIFMHIHKCAGTSLIDAFEKRPEVVSCVARPGNFPRRTGRERIPDEIWTRSIKFTFVRNPFARVVSAYRMFAASERWRAVFPTFADFVSLLRWSDVHAHRVDSEVPTEDFVKTLDNVIHHCSAFGNPKYRIDEMDYVGRLETLRADLTALSEMLGFEVGEVSRLNASQSYAYRDYYSPVTREIISRVYGDDLARFDYTF